MYWQELKLQGNYFRIGKKEEEPVSDSSTFLFGNQLSVFYFTEVANLVRAFVVAYG